MKILAVFHNHADPTPHVADETRRVADLRETGVIEQIWLKADRSGAVLVVEADDADDARRQLSTLPLVERGISTIEVTELVPLEDQV
jgi:muconolactone delta-isomerase